MEGDFEGKEGADDCETLLEKLRSQKRVCNMQLTKLYSRLLRLMSREVTDVEELLSALEATQEKMLDVLQVLEDLIVIYQSKGDEQSLKRAEAGESNDGYGQTNCYSKGVFDLTYIESIVDE